MAPASAVEAVKAAVDLTVIDRGRVVDKYQLVADPGCFRALVEDMVRALAPSVEVVVAVETGGISFAAALCDRVSLPLAIVRRGDEPRVSGAVVDGRNVAIVKDMMRTGAAVARAASAVRVAGGIPGQVLCAINWNPELASELGAAGLTLTAAVVGWDLVTYA